MSEALLAARLLLVSAALLILPGLLLLKALGVAAAWPERIALAFSLSYSWVFLLSVIVPLFHLTADHAAVLTVIALMVSGAAAARAGTGPTASRSSTGERLGTLAVAAVLVCCALAGWILEPPFTGEEGLDLASLARFADGGVITFDNTSLLSDARSFYLFQPYQLALGVIARWSGIDPLIALIKFRAFLAPLALVLIYSLLRRLTLTRADAGAAFAVVLLFVALDMETWEWNSLFPFVRRGSVGAGVCVPALLGLCLAATREAKDRNEVVMRRVALACAPILLVASLSTHPLEMFTLLCFTSGLAVAIVAGLDRGSSRRQAVVLMLLLASSAGAYVAVHARAVPYVAEHERSDKESLRADLAGLAGDPLEAIAGGPTEGRPLLTRTFPATTVVVLGIPALALAVLRAPATAAMLALGIIPLALVYASPAGFILLKLLTSVETAMDVNAYFGLLGLIAIALAATALAHALLRAAEWGQSGFRAVVATAAAVSIFLWLGWMGAQAGVAWIVDRSTAQPEFLLLVGTIVGACVLAIAWRRNGGAAGADAIVDCRDRPGRVPRSPARHARAGVRGCIREPSSGDHRRPFPGGERRGVGSGLAPVLRTASPHVRASRHAPEGGRRRDAKAHSTPPGRACQSQVQLRAGRAARCVLYEPGGYLRSLLRTCRRVLPQLCSGGGWSCPTASVLRRQRVPHGGGTSAARRVSRLVRSGRSGTRRPYRGKARCGGRRRRARVRAGWISPVPDQRARSHNARPMRLATMRWA